MTAVSKITDGVGTSYDLAVRMDNVQPIMEKSWTGLISSANGSSGSGCDFILGEFNTSVSNWVLEVELDCEYTATDWSSNKATSHHICHVEGVSNGTICYSMWNNIRSSSYRPFYYFIVYKPSTATDKLYFGVSMYNCNRNTTASNARSITCKVRSIKNMTNFALHDSPANTDYATYYVNMSLRTAYDIYTNGLRESGDDNSTVNVGANDIYAYCDTSADVAAKAAYFSYFSYNGTRVFKMRIVNPNTASTPTLNVNSQGARPIYLLTASNTWSAASDTVKTITANIHWVYFNGTNFYILPDDVPSTAVSTDNAYLYGQASYHTKSVFLNGNAGIGVPFKIRVDTANTATGDLSLDVNASGGKPLYFNGDRANGTSNNLTTGWFNVVYDGTNYNVHNTNSKMVFLGESTYSSTGTRAVNGTAVASAINALDVSDTAVDGKVVSAVSETDGKISVTRRALVAADIPNLDATKITTGRLDYWRQEAYTLNYHRATTSSGDGKQWTKFAWKEVSNYATGSVWDSCDGAFDVYRKSYSTTGFICLGELHLTSSWGHNAGTGYSFKTSGSKDAVWESYVNKTINANEVGSESSGRFIVKVVCTDTTIEWWMCNQIWDCTVYLKPRFKTNFTGLINNSDSTAVLKTLDEFTEYCEGKLVKTCEYGNSYTPMVYRANHVSPRSNYKGYLDLDFSDSSLTWGDFCAASSNTNSFCYKLFGDTSFDTTNYTVRSVGRVTLNSTISSAMGLDDIYVHYEVSAARQRGYVRFSSMNNKTSMYYFNRYGALTSKYQFVGNVVGNASTATNANNLMINPRVASANVGNTELKKFKLIQASSSMATGRPDSDGTIMHFNWDTNVWASQINIPVSNSGKMQFRSRENSTATWKNWQALPADITGSADSVPNLTNAEIDTIWTNNN